MTITYTQAVVDYQSQGEMLEAGHQKLKGDIATFLKGAKNLIYSNTASAEQAKMQQLEKQLQ